MRANDASLHDPTPMPVTLQRPANTLSSKTPGSTLTATQTSVEQHSLENSLTAVQPLPRKWAGASRDPVVAASTSAMGNSPSPRIATHSTAEADGARALPGQRCVDVYAQPDYGERVNAV